MPSQPPPPQPLTIISAAKPDTGRSRALLGGGCSAGLPEVVALDYPDVSPSFLLRTVGASFLFCVVPSKPMDLVEISTLVRQLFRVLAFFAAMTLPWKFTSKQKQMKRFPWKVHFGQALPMREPYDDSQDCPTSDFRQPYSLVGALIARVQLLLVQLLYPSLPRQ